MRIKLWISAFVFMSCAERSPSNDYLADPPEPPHGRALVQIVASDIRLHFPKDIEIYVKIINLGPDAAQNVKATMSVHAKDESAGNLIMSFRDGGTIGVYEYEKRTLAMKFDSSLNLHDSSDVSHGPIVLSWETK